MKNPFSKIFTVLAISLFIFQIWAGAFGFILPVKFAKAADPCPTGWTPISCYTDSTGTTQVTYSNSNKQAYCGNNFCGSYTGCYGDDSGQGENVCCRCDSFTGCAPPFPPAMPGYSNGDKQCFKRFSDGLAPVNPFVETSSNTSPIGCCVFDGGKGGCIDGWRKDVCEAQGAELKEGAMCQGIYECTVHDPIYLEVGIPGLPEGGKKVDNLTHYIVAIYNYSIYAISILAVVMIMFNGFMWLMAAGNKSKIDSAKEKIIDCLIGLLLALGSYIILSIINPSLVNLNMPGIVRVRPVQQQVNTASKICPLEFKGEKVPCGETRLLDPKDPKGEGCIGVYCKLKKTLSMDICTLDFIGGTYQSKNGCVQKVDTSDGGGIYGKVKGVSNQSCGEVVGDSIGYGCPGSSLYQCYILYPGGTSTVELTPDNKKALYACCNGAVCNTPNSYCTSGYIPYKGFGASIFGDEPCGSILPEDSRAVFCCQNGSFFGKYDIRTQSWVNPPTKNLCEDNTVLASAGQPSFDELILGYGENCGIGYFDLNTHDCRQGIVCGGGSVCAATFPGVGSCKTAADLGRLSIVATAPTPWLNFDCENQNSSDPNTLYTYCEPPKVCADRGDGSGFKCF